MRYWIILNHIIPIQNKIPNFDTRNKLDYSIFMKKVALRTLGCKLNFAESSSLAGIFIQNNYEQVSFKEFADFKNRYNIRTRV